MTLGLGSGLILFIYCNGKNCRNNIQEKIKINTIRWLNLYHFILFFVQAPSMYYFDYPFSTFIWIINISFNCFSWRWVFICSKHVENLFTTYLINFVEVDFKLISFPYSYNSTLRMDYFFMLKNEFLLYVIISVNNLLLDIQCDNNSKSASYGKHPC